MAAIVTIGPNEVLFLPVGPDTAASPLAGGAYYVCGAVIGAASGSLQAASRTLMAHLAARERMAEAFGLFALAGRGHSVPRGVAGRGDHGSFRQPARGRRADPGAAGGGAAPDGTGAGRRRSTPAPRPRSPGFPASPFGAAPGERCRAGGAEPADAFAPFRRTPQRVIPFDTASHDAGPDSPLLSNAVARRTCVAPTNATNAVLPEHRPYKGDPPGRKIDRHGHLPLDRVGAESRNDLLVVAIIFPTANVIHPLSFAAAAIDVK